MVKMVSIIQGDHRIENFNKVFAGIDKTITNTVDFNIYEIHAVDNDDDVFGQCAADIESADFIYIDLHGGLTYFKSYIRLSELFVGKKRFYFYSGIESEIAEMSKQCGLTPLERGTIHSYDNAGGAENIRNLLLYIFNKFCDIDCGYDDVKIPEWDGIYADIESDSTKPVIGIIIHYHYIQYNNLAHIDNLIESIKRHGCIPYAIFTNIMPTSDGKYGGIKAAMDKYFIRDGKVIIDSLIMTAGYSMTIMASPGDGRDRIDSSIFEKFDVPVFQALTTQLTYDEWVKALAGLDPAFLAINVYHTEFDGQIITVPIAYTDKIKTEFGLKSIYYPMPERVDKLVRLVKNWSMLRRTPMSEKRVAIILHNMPPRTDMIGMAYGLDTPVSVYNMYRDLLDNGLTMEYEFSGGRDIIDKIISGLTNDGRYLSPDQMLDRASAVVEKADYLEWYGDYSEKVKSELYRDWGDIPGEVMTCGDKILIPGIINGNLFIGLQPPRAFEEKAEEMYHSTDLVCPYQYLAFYKYLERIFKADIVVHVGTHGTLEWLPGKEIALSCDCYPDIAIGDLPHIYPYIIDVPGEGVQAKRRSAAAILDHLIPSMKHSGTYGELARFDELSEQYYKSMRDDKNKLSELTEEIWKLTLENNLHTDLDMTEESYHADVNGSIEKLHLWIQEIKTSEVKDGLHTFGLPPQDEADGRMKNMLRLLVRVRNGEIPSIREAVCKSRGSDLDYLLDNPNYETTALINEIDEYIEELFDSLMKNEYRINNIQNTDILKCLNFVCNEVYPRLQLTTDELKYFMKGVNGEFVIPGQSGAPSRGNAMILPTGRNFYTVDPATIPNKVAWKTGITLAKELLEKHGEIPESIAIIVYSGETMKTNGDDIAEILYLYGVKPVYLGSTDRVIGLEVIPLDELKRPRIDVTLRISGLFRDTFPNLIELIDDAVNLVASLDEPHEMNFIRKHVVDDIKKFVNDGVADELAEQYAKLRIFGCPPGTYGAGVDILINSKKWQTSDDLGQAYITWSGHAYSKQLHGDKLQNVFSHRLSGVDATIKNISSVESDMLDDDDYYNYHGGMIAAVKKEKGVLPSSYSTNTADINHVVTKNIHEETSRIMRSRINNPKCIEGLKKHDFRGAGEFAAMVDFVFGWDATSDIIDDWMYDSLFETYINDEELRGWIKEANPWALHSISERLMEAAQRGMWNASEDKIEELRNIYLEAEEM